MQENEATTPFHVYTDKVMLYCSGFFIVYVYFKELTQRKPKFKELNSK